MEKESGQRHLSVKARQQHGVWKPALGLSEGTFPEGADQGASNILASFQIPIESLKRNQCARYVCPSLCPSTQKAEVGGFQF